MTDLQDLVVVVVNSFVGVLAGYWAHRYRWWVRRRWSEVRWHLWQRWRLHRIPVRPPELLYLLRVSQQVTGHRRYNAMIPVAETVLDDLGSEAISWAARSLDDKLLTDTGMVTQDREWSIRPQINSPVWSQASELG